MTAPRNDLPSDPQLSRLYREQAVAEPTDAVDQRLLALARQASGSPAIRRQGWWQRWRLPLSLATTVMLTAMLALLVERQPAELPLAPSMEKKALNGVEERAEPAPVHPALVPAAPASAPAQHKSLPKAPGGQSGGERSPAAKRAAEQKAEAPAPSAPPAVAASEAAVSGERRAAPALLAAPPAAASLLKSTADSAPSPAAWLEEIRALRRAGKAEEAARQLSEFRLAYPDYPLPEEFRQ